MKMLKKTTKKFKTFFNNPSYIYIMKKGVLISLIVGIVSGVFIYIVYLFVGDLAVSLDIFAFIKNFGTALIAVLTLILTIFQILQVKAKPEEEKEIKQIIKSMLCILMICIVPVSESYAFHAFIDPRVTRVQNSNTTPDPTDISSTNPDAPTFTFEISFDDILFDNYSVEEVEEHKEELKIGISKKIFSDIVNSNKENTKEYETKVEQAGEYEKVYFFIVENDLFKNHHLDFRYLILQHSIDLRVEANIYCVKFANQRLIVLRYIDLKDEYIRNKNTNELTSIYSEAIEWSLISSQTAYVEGEDIHEMLNKVSNLYTEFAEHLDPESESHQKAIILSDVYEDIKNDIN